MAKPKSDKIIHPTQCPKCKSKNIMGYGSIMGYGYINLETMEVDEPSDDFEIYDEESLEYQCSDCEHEWELN